MDGVKALELTTRKIVRGVGVKDEEISLEYANAILEQSYKLDPKKCDKKIKHKIIHNYNESRVIKKTC